MFISNLYNVSAVILTLGLVKISLSRSGFSLLLTISLGCSLSYCFFENGLTFLPFASYFLKDRLEFFSLLLKKWFTTIKNSFSFTGNQTEEKDVGAEQPVKMVKGESEKQTSSSLSNQESAFDSEKGKGGEEGKVLKEGGNFTLIVNKDTAKLGVDIGVSVAEVAMVTAPGFLLAKQFLKSGFSHLMKCRNSNKLRKYGTYGTIGMWFGAYLLVHLNKRAASETSDLLKAKLKVLIDGAEPASNFPEIRAQTDALKEELEKEVSSHVFFKKGVTGELIFITNEKTIEYLSALLDDFCTMVKDKRFDINLMDAHNLSREEKELFQKQLKSLTPKDLSLLREEHPELFRSVLLLAKAMVHPDKLQQQLIAFCEKQTLVYPQQESEGETGPSPHIDNLNYVFLARVKVSSLPYLGEATMDQMVEQVIGRAGISVSSHDQYYVSPEQFKEQERVAKEKALSNIRDYHERMYKRAQELSNASDNDEAERRRLPSISEQEKPFNDQGEIATQIPSDDAPTEPQRQRFLSISISEEEELSQGEPSRTGGSSLSQLPSPQTPPPPWQSPWERNVVEKDWHSQLANFELAFGVLLAICRACVGLLGKLGYTKRFIERMIKNGFPRFVFFWYLIQRKSKFLRNRFLIS